MKYDIYKDEWYPVYTLEEDSRSNIEISDELLNKYAKVNKEFDEVQRELLILYEKKQ